MYFAPSKSGRSACGLVQQEVLDEHLEVDAHAPAPGGQGRGERFLAAHVDDVGGRAGQLGEGHQVVHALGLDEGRPALVVLGRIGLAGGEQLPRPLGDERLVLAMRGDDDAEFPGQPEHAVEFRVVEAVEALVGEEDFERADAPRDDLAQLRRGGGVELRHAHVKREIAGGLAGGCVHPLFEAGERPVPAPGVAHLDDRGGAADERRLAAGHKIVLRLRAPGRQVEVDVRVDEAGENLAAPGVDDLGVRRRRQAARDAGDRFAVAVDVREVALTRGDDFAVLDQEGHGWNGRSRFSGAGFGVHE